MTLICKSQMEGGEGKHTLKEMKVDKDYGVFLCHPFFSIGAAGCEENCRSYLGMQTKILRFQDE